MHVYTHVLMHIHTHVYTHVETRVYTRVYARVHTHDYTHVSMVLHLSAHKRETCIVAKAEWHISYGILVMAY